MISDKTTLPNHVLNECCALNITDINKIMNCMEIAVCLLKEFKHVTSNTLMQSCFVWCIKPRKKC